PALEKDRRGNGNDLPILHAAELPLVAWNGARRTQKAIPYGECACRARWIDRRIPGCVSVAPHVIEGVSRIGGVGDERGRYPASDGLSLIGDGRRIERHQSSTARNVE